MVTATGMRTKPRETSDLTPILDDNSSEERSICNVGRIYAESMECPTLGDRSFRQELI